jgi:hypothetical protein
VFDDGSVGWYEAGWGPMMSETAFFVKDVVSPNGCVSIQAFVLRAIREDVDLSRHMTDAVQSLRICLAADESVRSGAAIDL